MKRLKNINHEKFARIKAETTKDNKIAYKEVYPQASDRTAEVNSSRLLDNPKIQTRIAQLLDKQGMTEQQLNLRLEELSMADKYIIHKGRLKLIPDNSVRLSAIQTAYKLHGHLTSTLKDTYEDNRQVNITVNEGDMKRLDSIISAIKELKTQEPISNGEIV